MSENEASLCLTFRHNKKSSRRKTTTLCLSSSLYGSYRQWVPSGGLRTLSSIHRPGESSFDRDTNSPSPTNSGHDTPVQTSLSGPDEPRAPDPNSQTRRGTTPPPTTLCVPSLTYLFRTPMACE